MKALLVLAILLFLCLSAPTFAGTLKRVEQLTESENSELQAAYKTVQEANKDVERVQKRIMQAHKMDPQEWMEWRSWVEFDGDFILFKYQSHMEPYLIEKGK